ncbi:hypothetical protein C2845_PM09G11620 [Panicum miliaceum]|uniref:DUF4220 domain-containing protein n=1 Tax=Panicum miliaceum TaxID=4540 RepID=A0A3L6S0B1_PANMI|nr:hypothetical protein C2845_PM09G11620 [Panicum miliaceum]
MVPILQLIALVIITEGRDIASYICSNWTKVALICRTVNRASSHHFLHMPAKWVGLLLNCRCKLLNHWDGKMGQCSVLVTGPRTSLVVALSHLLRVPIPDRKRKVKVPEAVKVCIIDTLRRSINDNGRRLSNGTSSLRRIQGGESFVWACNGGDTCGSILVWHIATCIFDVKDPYRRDQERGSPPISYSHHKIAATHLSRYCAYLVTWCPELLPDDNDAWIKSLYKVVKKDAERALAGHALARSSSSSTPEEEYQKLVELLSANSKHEVLKKGVKLGKQLVETIDSEEMVWKLLAEFWSEMILYVALSDNLKGHSEAIARGGELITLLWALLFHAGIVSRPGEEDGAAATSAGAV